MAHRDNDQEESNFDKNFKQRLALAWKWNHWYCPSSTSKPKGKDSDLQN